MAKEQQLDKFTLPKQAQDVNEEQQPLNREPGTYSAIYDTYDRDMTEKFKSYYKKITRSLRAYERYHAKQFGKEIHNEEDNEEGNNQRPVNLLRTVSDTCSFHKNVSEDFKWMRAQIAHKAFQQLGWQPHLGGDCESKTQLKAKVNFYHEYRNRSSQSTGEANEEVLLKSIANNVTPTHVMFIAQLKSTGRNSILTKEFLQTVANCDQNIIEQYTEHIGELRQAMARWGAFYEGKKGVSNRLRLIINRWSKERAPNHDQRTSMDQQFIRALGQLSQDINNSHLKFDQLYNAEKDDIQEQIVNNVANFSNTLNTLKTKQTLRQDPNMSWVMKDISNKGPEFFNSIDSQNFIKNFIKLNNTMSRYAHENRLRQLIRNRDNNKQTINANFAQALNFLGGALQSNKNSEDYHNDNHKLTSFKRLQSKLGDSAVQDGRTMIQNYHVDYDKLKDTEKKQLIENIGKNDYPELTAKQQLAKHSIRQYLTGQYSKGQRVLGNDEASRVEKNISHYIETFNDTPALDQTMAALQQLMGDSNINITHQLLNNSESPLVKWLFQQGPDGNVQHVNQMEQKVQAMQQIAQNLKQNNKNQQQIEERIDTIAEADRNNHFTVPGNAYPQQIAESLQRQERQYALRSQFGLPPKAGEISYPENEHKGGKIQAMENSVLYSDNVSADDVDRSRQAIEALANNNNQVYNNIKNQRHMPLKQMLLQINGVNHNIVNQAQALGKICDQMADIDNNQKLVILNNQLMPQLSNHHIELSYDKTNEQPKISLNSDQALADIFNPQNPQDELNSHNMQTLRDTLTNMNKNGQLKVECNPQNQLNNTI